MTDLPMLTECSWRPAERPDLTRTLLPGLDAPEGAYACFLEDPAPGAPPRVLVGLATTQEVLSGTPLADHLRRHGHLATDLLSAAFVLDTFTLSDAWRGTPVTTLRPTFRPLALVDRLLRDSYGLLVWHHQLEALFGLFVRPADEQICLRKGINARRADAFERARSLVLASDVTLEDVIEERMAFGAVARANFHGARLLLEAQHLS